ncbi:YsnF/AvaK domain-containing protein [Pseudomonas sp. DC3000-4b1]|uniref:YsnF/AvaK domain-containing protein n=1 Tax=unclassified Pseudomonas TaxID=196821 RepID=UPI003CF6C1B9
MKHTLVAAFDDLTTAQAAKAKLLALNISDSNITLSAPQTETGTTVGSTMATGSAHGDHHDDSMGGKISHFFHSLFGSDDDGQPHRYASAYPEAYRRGATLVTVTAATDEEAERIESLLEEQGAIDIDERSASWTDGAPMTARAGEVSHLAGTHQGITATDTTATTADLSGRTAIPVIEEELRVGKRDINTGKVRVVTRVTERPVEETVSLREEHASIQRRPVDRAATAADLQAFKEGSVEIQETAQEVVVDKSARVVEEISVGKKATEHTETVRDKVRRTDVDVQATRQNQPIGAAASAERNTPFKDR